MSDYDTMLTALHKIANGPTHPYHQKIARDALAEVMETDSTQDHQLITEGDEYKCTKCHKRWGFDDDDIPGCD